MKIIDKVLFIAPRFHTNQIGVVNALLKKGIEVEFHVLIKGPTEDYSVLSPVKVDEGRTSRLISRFIKTKKVNNYYSFPSFTKYFTKMKDVNADLVIIRDPGRFFSLVAAIAARLIGIKICFYTQETVSIEMASKLRYRIQRLYKIIFNAEWITPIGGVDTQLKKFLPFVVEPRFENAIKNIQYTQSYYQKNIVVIGKFTKRKRLDWAVKLAHYFDCKFTIIGEKSTYEHNEIYQELLKYIKDNNLADRVKLRCNLSHFETLKELSNSDFFLLTAKNEPASISVLESLSVGVPVLCPDGCGTASYLSIGETGFVYKQDSFEDLKDNFNKLLEYISINLNVRVECINSAALNFSEKTYIEKFNHIFRRG